MIENVTKTVETRSKLSLNLFKYSQKTSWLKLGSYLETEHAGAIR